MRAKSLTPLKLRMIKIIPFILGIWAIWYWRVPIQKLMSFIGDREAIANYLQQYGAVGPVILFLILMFQVFFAFIPGHAIIISGGYIYGLMIGASITQVSTVLATQIAFYLARIAGRPFVDRLCPTHIVDKWNALAEKQGGLFFFFSFILPIFPNDLMGFIADLSSISGKKFFVANFLGRLPCAIFITLIGSHGYNLSPYFWSALVLIILGLCFSWNYLSSYLEDGTAEIPQLVSS